MISDPLPGLIIGDANTMDEAKIIAIKYIESQKL